MSTAATALAAAQQLDGVAQALDEQLHSLEAQLQRLKLCKKVLCAHHQKARVQDKSTQADDGPSINALRHIRTPHDACLPFTFSAPSTQINWKGLRGVDPQRLLANNDTASAMQLFDEVAYGDLEGGSIYERSEANLLKVSQLQLQYLQYKLEQKLQAEQVLEDDALALVAGLSSLVPPSLGDISSTLGGISSDLQALGGTRVGGLIQQVRAEERSAAKAALNQAIESTKQQLVAKHAAAGQQQAAATAAVPE